MHSSTQKETLVTEGLFFIHYLDKLNSFVVLFKLKIGSPLSFRSKRSVDPASNELREDLGANYSYPLHSSFKALNSSLLLTVTIVPSCRVTLIGNTNSGRGR